MSPSSEKPPIDRVDENLPLLVSNIPSLPNDEKSEPSVGVFYGSDDSCSNDVNVVSKSRQLVSSIRRGLSDFINHHTGTIFISSVPNRRSFAVVVDTSLFSHVLRIWLFALLSGSIGWLGSISIAVNSLTGPAMLNLPATFQKSGLIPTLATLVFVCVLSALCSLHMANTISKVPGNEKFERHVRNGPGWNVWFNNLLSGSYTCVLFHRSRLNTVKSFDGFGEIVGLPLHKLYFLDVSHV
jgi:hypothetical protein